MIKRLTQVSSRVISVKNSCGYKNCVLVKISTGSRSHTQVRIIQGGLIYKWINYKGMGEM